MQGGGQSDIWHNLTCKSRYAGEIRIELTYYDTRPRDGKLEKSRQPSQAEDLNDHGRDGRDGIGGPRQPKTARRRPLPADPTGSSQSTQLSHIPPPQQPIELSMPQQRHSDPPAPRLPQIPPQQSQISSFHDQLAQDPRQFHQSQHHLEYEAVQQHTPIVPHGTRSREASVDAEIAYEGNRVAPAPVHDLGNNQAYQYHQQYYDMRDGMPANEQSHSPYRENEGLDANVQYNSGSPTARMSPHQVTPSPRATPQYHRSSLSHSVSADVSPLPSPLRQNSLDQWSEPQADTGYDERPPPLPPTHRMSPSMGPTRSSLPSPPHPYSQVPAPAPLNLRTHRDSIPGSPLSQVQVPQSDRDYALSNPPLNVYEEAHPQSNVASKAPHNQLRQHRSYSPIRDSAQPMPPSLVPGYEPSVAAEESERTFSERRFDARQHFAVQQTQPRIQQNPVPPSQNRAQGIPRAVDAAQDRRAHRNSAPVVKPTGSSPVIRAPVRKSVSPRPGSFSSERGRSELPFSPDSFDAFNPNVGAARGATQAGARYNTPEQARETSIQHERGLKLGNEPIIGNDGRVIDPSDHLPTDTWAPEPEQKTPRKTAEVKLRFRQSPHGAQPMPQAGRRPLVEARPNVLSSAGHAHSTGSSPVSTPRTRLQKQSRMGNAQVNSSPTVPTLDTSSQRQFMPRSSVPDHPLRERENPAYYGASPTYGNRSPGGVPPPVPGKVPLLSGQEDWGNRSLSEEMSRIDIGVGGGHRSRARRYGF